MRTVVFYRTEEKELAVLSAFSLRAMGVRTDLYLLPEKKMKAQYEYAEKNRIARALSFKDGRYVVKDLATRESHDATTLEEVATLCR